MQLKLFPIIQLKSWLVNLLPPANVAPPRNKGKTPGLLRGNLPSWLVKFFNMKRWRLIIQASFAPCFPRRMLQESLAFYTDAPPTPAEPPKKGKEARRFRGSDPRWGDESQRSQRLPKNWVVWYGLFEESNVSISHDEWRVHGTKGIFLPIH